MADDERRAEIEGVWHKDGPLAQVEAMAEWAERMGDPADNRHWETARKIAKNLRAAVESLSGAPSRDGTVAVEDVERLVDALRRIERLKDRWQAPLRHPVGDMGDPAYASAAAWAAVGSEAHKIAVDALAEFARPATGEQTDHGGNQ